jgi:UDP-2,3-diacylglucosamine pyrophosphatase LpxH
VWSARQRVRDVDAASALRRAAGRIAELFPARFVVMGHTHKPVFERLTDAATYVNLGNWAVDDLDGAAQEAPRTHLVLRWIDGQPQAEFRRWDSLLGPQRFG